MKNLLSALVFLVGFLPAMLWADSADLAKQPSFSIVNNSQDIVEFSGLVGGYTSTNPLIAQDQTTILLPDPAAKIMRGHIMVYTKNSQQYLDNIVFEYKLVNQHWVFIAYDLY